MFDVAGPDFTPGGFLVFMTSRAGAGEILFAGTTVKTAVRNQRLVGSDWFHDESGLDS